LTIGVGFPHRNEWFFHTGHLFFRSLPGSARGHLCVFIRLNLSPIVRWLNSARIPACEAIAVGRAVFCVTGPATLGHLHEAKGHKLANGWRNRLMIYAVLSEIGIRNRQATVICSAVVGEFDLEPV
jgi:hypothetical protein